MGWFGKKEKDFKTLTIEAITTGGELKIRAHFNKSKAEDFVAGPNVWLHRIPRIVVRALAEHHGIVGTQKTEVKTQSSIWHVLGMMPTTDRTKVIAAYKRMAMIYHPDHGGDSKAFQTLTDAKEKALAKCR